MHAETSADFADMEGSDDDFVTTYIQTKRASYMKSVKCIDPAQLESRISAVEDAIKDWRRHKRDKEELIKANLFQEVIVLYSPVASNLAPAIPAYINGYLKAPPALTARHQWMLILVQESFRQSN